MTISLPSGGRGAIQLLLTLVVTWFILSRVGVTLGEIAEAPGALPDHDAGWLFLSALLLLFGFLLAARSWGWMVKELGGEDPGGRASIRVVLLSSLGRYIPGKFWQVAGLALLGRRTGVSATLSTASGILGQSFALVAAGVVALPALLRTDTGFEGGGRTVLLGLGLALLLTLISTPPLLRGVLRFAFRLSKLPEDQVPKGSLSFGPRWFAWHLLVWGIYGCAFLLFIQGVGFDGSTFFFASSFAAAYLLGYLALFAPAGIGVREGILVALLRPEIGSSAVGIAVLARLWITLVELLPAGVLLLMESTTRRGEGG